MSLQARSAKAHIDASTAMFAEQLPGLIAGEALGPASVCYIKSSDGKVYQSNGTAANEAAKVDGFSPEAKAPGQAVTLFGRGTRYGYGTGLTIGQNFYLAATAGQLDTAPTTGGLKIIARAVSATDIVVFDKA